MGVPDAAGVLVDGLIVEYSYQLFFFFWWQLTGPKVFNDPARRALLIEVVSPSNFH